MRPVVPLAPAFAIYYAAYFVVGGMLQAYWPVWLTARGLNAEQLGLLFLGGQWIRVGAILCYGRIADRFGVARPMIVALADGLAIRHAGARRFDYGRVRLWGSLGYIAAVLAGGLLLKQLGVDAIYACVLVGCAATTLIASQLQAPAHIQHSEPAPPRAMARLLASPVFWIFMIAAGASQVSHAVYYGFATLNWQLAGIDDRVIGLLWGEGVVAEVLLFAFARRVLARIGVTGLLALAGIGGMLRWTGIALTADLLLLFGLQILHALTFGAAHLASMHFMQRAVPERAMSSAQSLYYALPLGIGMGLAMSLAGVLFRDYAGHAYLAMTALSAVTLGGALLLNRQWRGGKII